MLKYAAIAKLNVGHDIMNYYCAQVLQVVLVVLQVQNANSLGFLPEKLKLKG